MKLKTTQHPLKFIVLLMALFLMSGVQAQSSCDSALVIQVNSVDTFYMGDSEMWFRFQATTATVLLHLNTEEFVPQTEVADLVFYSGSCEEPLIQGVTMDSLNTWYASGLIVNDYFYIKITPGDTAGFFVLSLTESNPIQVYFDFDCIPECDNLVFNGGFEINLPHHFHPCCDPNELPPCTISGVNWLYYYPFNTFHDDCFLINPTLNQTYSDMVCKWGTFNFVTPQLFKGLNNNTFAYMWAHSIQNEAITTDVYMKAGITYTIEFDYLLLNTDPSVIAESKLAFYASPSPTSLTSYMLPLVSIAQSPTTWTSHTMTYQPVADVYAISFFPEMPTYGRTHFYIDNIKISPPKPEECPIISGPEVVCPGTTIITYTITNYDPVYVYRYSINGGPLQIAYGNTIQVDLATISGSQVEIWVKNWCECYGTFTTLISCDPTPTADAVFLDGDVITQTLFSGDVIFICGGVFVGANVTFDNNCELIFAPKSSMIVLPGFSVTFDNSLLTDACQLQWKGVFADYHNTSIVVQNNCTIKHALNAIVSSEGASLDITNSLFHNNTTAVKIRQYDQYCDLFNPPPPLPPHPAYFAGNTFTRDISISFPGLLGPYTGIMIDTVYEVTVGDYTMLPAVGRNSFVNLDYGIKVSYSNVFVYNNLFDNIAKGTHMPVTNPQNNHPDEGAIYAWSVIPPPPSPNHPAPPPQLQSSCIAKRITVGGQYQYQPNEFIDCNIGVYSDKFRINCDWNVFTSQRFNAVYSVDPGFESTVRNNQITQVPGLWATSSNATHSIFDAAIRLANTFPPGNGKSIGVNNNIIHHAKTGISLTNQTSAITSSSPHKAIANGNQIFFSNVDGSNKYWHGIRLEGCRGIQVGGNEVESSEPGNAGAGQEHVIGIYVSSTPYASIRDNSHLKNLFSGIFVVGNCLATQFYCNDFKGCKYGFYFKPYNGGAATVISEQYPIFAGVQYPSDNVWVNHIDDFQRMWGDLNITGTGPVNWYHRHYNDATTIFGPNIPPGVSHPLENKIIPVQTTGNSPCIAIINPWDEDWDGATRNARLGAVVREEIEYAEMIDEFEYFDQQYVYELLYSDPDIMYLGEDDDTAYINFYNYMTNSTIAEMTNINELIENGEINQALMENGVFVASNLIENNMQVVNDIYLNTLAQYIPFDSVQREALMAIAMLTPYLGGNAVYSARVMLGIDPRDYNLYHRFAPDTDLMKKETIKTLHVYPNPARDNLTIEILEGLEEGVVFIELYSLIGNRVLTSTVEIVSSKGDLNISGITRGVYLLRVSCEKGSHKSTKIMIH